MRGGRVESPRHGAGFLACHAHPAPAGNPHWPSRRDQRRDGAWTHRSGTMTLMAHRPRRCAWSQLLTVALLAASAAVPLPVAGAPSTVRLVLTLRPGIPLPCRPPSGGAGRELVDHIDQLNVRVVEVPAAVANAGAGGRVWPGRQPARRHGQRWLDCRPIRLGQPVGAAPCGHPGPWDMSVAPGGRSWRW